MRSSPGPLTPNDVCNATLLSSERRRTPLQVT